MITIQKKRYIQWWKMENVGCWGCWRCCILAFWTSFQLYVRHIQGAWVKSRIRRGFYCIFVSVKQKKSQMKPHLWSKTSMVYGPYKFIELSKMVNILDIKREDFRVRNTTKKRNDMEHWRWSVFNHFQHPWHYIERIHLVQRNKFKLCWSDEQIGKGREKKRWGSIESSWNIEANSGI